MRLSLILCRRVILAVVLSVASGAVNADDDHERAQILARSGDIKSLEDILKKLRKNEYASILEVELEYEDGIYIYEMELLDKKGGVREIMFNAETGERIERNKNKNRKKSREKKRGD